MNSNKLLITALLAAALVLAIACGDDDTGSGGSPSTTEDGTPRPTAPLNLPDDYPEDFPLYADASLEQGLRFQSSVLAVFTVDATKPDVVAFYSEALGQDPWQLNSERDNDQGTITTITFVHLPENIRGTVTISQHDPNSQTEINTSFVLPEASSPLFTIEPTEDTPTPADNEAE